MEGITMANSSPVNEKALEMTERERMRLELEKEFSYDDYVVVRKELFAHLRDAAAVIRPDSITFNQACVNGLEGAVYIRLSVNEHIHRILVEPCTEDTPHALRWCTESGGKRKSRTMTSKDFSGLLYKVMGWDKSIRYKVLGFRINIRDFQAYVFMLDTPEKFEISDKKQGGMSGEKKRVSAKGYYDSDVLDSFGIPALQYQKDTAIVNSEDGFIQMGILNGEGESPNGKE